jgi:DNA-binding transcriptional ArsR family regulator
MSAGRAAEPGAVFEVLSDPTRRQIITWLAEDGPMSATRLAERLPLTRQGVAKHLLLMAHSGIVMQARVGREVRFSIEAERLGSAAAWLSTVGARWDRRLASLEAHVSSRSTRQD